VGMLLSGLQGHRHAYIIARTDSGKVGGRPEKGKWTVGYASIAIDQVPGGKDMLTSGQRKELLEIARSSIRQFLETGKRSAVRSTDPLLAQVQGAFVTLHRKGQLRGCIGTIVGQKPLYVTVRDMAVEAATGDPRFPKVTLAELGELEIEISVLSPLRRVAGAADIELGTHGVLVRKGAQSGVFLPQVAQETNWSKEEFLSYLCTHKAFLPADAWKDASTELYVFTAEVFSEHGA
jgi:AmmeMemoRadiSam system protein A